MLYTKPKGVKYTDMCIYIDKKVKEGSLSPEDEDKVFEYLFHISFMLAHKHKYFKESHYYEDFAVYFATEIMYRLFYNPKLNKLNENGEPVLTPIKSCLNYMKAVIYGRKCAFEKLNYCQKIIEVSNTEVPLLPSSLNSKLEDTIHDSKEVDVGVYLENLSSAVYHAIYTKNYYANDKVLMKYIYISCMLSIINAFTFNEPELNSIKSKYTLPDSKYKYIEKLYKYNRDNCVILYHLDDSFYNYIKLQVRKILSLIREDIIELSKVELNISDDILSEIVYLELDGKVEFD